MENQNVIAKVNGVNVPSSEKDSLDLWNIMLWWISQKDEIKKILSGLCEKNIKTREMWKWHLESCLWYIERNKLEWDIAKNIEIDDKTWTSKLKKEFADKIISAMSKNYITDASKIKWYNYQHQSYCKDYYPLYSSYISEWWIMYNTSIISSIADLAQNNQEFRNYVVDKIWNFSTNYILSVFHFLKSMSEDRESAGDIFLKIMMDILISRWSMPYSYVDKNGKNIYIQWLPIRYADRDSWENFHTIIHNYEKFVSKFDELKSDYELAFADIFIFYVYHIDNIKDFVKDDRSSPAGSYLNWTWINSALYLSNNIIADSEDARVVEKFANLWISKESFADKPKDPEWKEGMTKQERSKYNKDLSLRNDNMINIVKNKIKENNLYDTSIYENVLKN